jgi:hypothetical protein
MNIVPDHPENDDKSPGWKGLKRRSFHGAPEPVWRRFGGCDGAVLGVVSEAGPVPMLKFGNSEQS